MARRIECPVGLEGGLFEGHESAAGKSPALPGWAIPASFETSDKPSELPSPRTASPPPERSKAERARNGQKGYREQLRRANSHTPARAGLSARMVKLNLFGAFARYR